MSKETQALKFYDDNEKPGVITPDDLTGAGAVLNQNTSYVNIYRKSQAKLVEEAKADGDKLKPETDAKINKWLVSAKLALKKMEEDRKPYTSKAMEFIKLFTTAENTIGKELYQELQDIRDRSLSAYRAEENAKRRAEELELKKKQERITLLSQAEQQVREAYAAILRDEKHDLLMTYDKATAETIDDVEKELANLNPVFLKSQWDEISVNIQSNILDQREIDNVITNSKLGKFDKCAEHFKNELKNYASHLVTLIPSRREEIEKGEESKKAAELKKEQEALEAEQARQAHAKAEKSRQEAIKAEQEAIALEQANRAVAEPETRSIDSYSITVSGADGWRKLVDFYLINSKETDLEKITGKQMKTFAEKWAKKHGEVIESEELEYEIKYKAVARKEKVA